MNTIKPNENSINQAVDAKIRDRDSRKRYPYGRENFKVNVKDPKTQIEYEIRYYF